MVTKFKKIGLIGAPYSGQTTLLFGMIGEMKRYYSATYQVLVDKDEDFSGKQIDFLTLLPVYRIKMILV